MEFAGDWILDKNKSNNISCCLMVILVLRLNEMLKLSCKYDQQRKVCSFLETNFRFLFFFLYVM